MWRAIVAAAVVASWSSHFTGAGVVQPLCRDVLSADDWLGGHALCGIDLRYGGRLACRFSPCTGGDGHDRSLCRCSHFGRARLANA